MKNYLLKNKFNFALLCGLLCAIFLSLAQFNVSCDELRANVLRLHIIANSNSKADQALKLKIRDAILEHSGNLFTENTDLDSAIETTCENLPQIERLANKVIKENGFTYNAKATVGDSFFETREYSDFTLPAGVYESLIIKVGEGKGKNWWCVIYPEICIGAAKGKQIKDVTTAKTAEIAENQPKYVMRFKIIELYESFKKRIAKK